MKMLSDEIPTINTQLNPWVAAADVSITENKKHAQGLPRKKPSLAFFTDTGKPSQQQLATKADKTENIAADKLDKPDSGKRVR